MDLHTELQSLAAEIAARHGVRQQLKPAQPARPAPAAPYFSTAYRCCSLCGSASHADGRCYGGTL